MLSVATSLHPAPPPRRLDPAEAFFWFLDHVSSMNFAVIAEGAETPTELAWLQENACDQVQGYVVARPMPLGEFLAWTATRDGVTA